MQLESPRNPLNPADELTLPTVPVDCVTLSLDPSETINIEDIHVWESSAMEFSVIPLYIKLICVNGL